MVSTVRSRCVRDVFVLLVVLLRIWRGKTPRTYYELVKSRLESDELDREM